MTMIKTKTMTMTTTTTTMKTHSFSHVHAGARLARALHYTISMGRVVSCGPRTRDRHSARIERFADGRWPPPPLLVRVRTGLSFGQHVATRSYRTNQHRTNKRTDTDVLLALCASTHRTAPHDARTHARTRVTVP